MKRYLLITLLVVSGILGACTGGARVELDVPDDVELELETGAPEEEFVFYALGESPPASWDDFKNRGLMICGECPPLLPDEVQALLDGGRFLPGTVLNLSSDDFESATEGRVKSKLGMKIIVTVGVTFDGCIKSALDKMAKSPGMLLLTERKADFDGKKGLAEITFK